MNKIKNIVFDIGNVLIDYNPQKLLNSFSELDGDGRELLMREVFKSSLWLEIDRGTYSMTEAIGMFRLKIPEFANVVDRLFLEESLDILFPEISDTVLFMQGLKRSGYRIYLLSNFSKEGFAFVEKKLPFLRESEVDGRIISSHVGLIKPDPAIYRLLLERFGLEASETVFFDDLQQNCEGAEAVGIRAIRFINAADAAKKLDLMLKDSV